MAHCDINLANGLIWPRMQRLLIYRLLVLYLFIMALLLLSLGIRSVQRLSMGIDYLSQGRELDQAFAAGAPNQQAGLKEYAELLRKQLEDNAARIRSVSEAMPPSIDTPLPALALIVNQCAKCSLRSLSFEQPSEEKPARLVFDLTAPVGVSQWSCRTAWLADPVLSFHFPEIRQRQQRLEEINGREFLITQYEAAGRD